MGLLDGIAPVARNLIDLFGTAVTLRRKTRTYDPQTGSSTESTTDHSLRGTISRWSDTLLVAGGEARAVGGWQATVAPSTAVTPRAGDHLVLDSELAEVTEVRPILAGDVIASYTLRCKGA